MSDNQQPETIEPRPASFLRRLGAVCYDTLLIVALLFTAAAILTGIVQLVSGGDGMQAVFQHPLTRIYLLLIGLGYLPWFWVRGGQTLGMRAWNLRIIDNYGRGLNWRLALRREGIAILTLLPAGIGLLWALFDPQGNALYDRWGDTRLIVVDRAGNPVAR